MIRYLVHFEDRPSITFESEEQALQYFRTGRVYHRHAAVYKLRDGIIVSTLASHDSPPPLTED